jgi:hypothetical protein
MFMSTPGNEHMCIAYWQRHGLDYSVMRVQQGSSLYVCNCENVRYEVAASHTLTYSYKQLKFVLTCHGSAYLNDHDEISTLEAYRCSTAHSTENCEQL